MKRLSLSPCHTLASLGYGLLRVITRNNSSCVVWNSLKCLWRVAASSGENFKRFKITVRVFISYACRADVVEVSHKLVQTSCICRHFSLLLAVWILALPGSSFSTSFCDISTTSVRHAYDVCATCTRDATRYRDKQQHLYDFVRVLFKHAHDIAPSSGEICNLQKGKAGKQQWNEFCPRPSLPPSPQLQREGPTFSSYTASSPGGQSYAWNILSPKRKDT